MTTTKEPLNNELYEVGGVPPEPFALYNPATSGHSQPSESLAGNITRPHPAKPSQRRTGGVTATLSPWAAKWVERNEQRTRDFRAAMAAPRSERHD
jgi:hypothetical protein